MRDMVPTGGEARETQLLRGALELAVLAVIATRASHAYEIAERLELHGFSNISYGTVYPLIMRLRRQGFLDQEAIASPMGPPRNVLTLTRTGHTALHDWRGRWERAADAVADVLAELDRGGVRHE